MGPLLLIMVAAGASAYGLALYFSQSVLDHWLYDSAISLANRVRWENGRTSVDLSEGAREILEWDVVDRIYFEVISEQGERLVANAALPPPHIAPTTERPTYYDAVVGDARVRMLAIALKGPHENPVIVKVAETQLKREALASRVLWISITLAVGLSALSAAIIWHAIGAGMNSIEIAVRNARRKHAVAPLSPIAIDPSIPQEVVPLVHEINDLIQDLSAAHRLNQRFIADAAHQLRTPLATLRVQLDVALRERDSSRHLQAINNAVALLTRMGRMLHQLLTLAKADENEFGNVGAGMVDIDLLAREELERRIDDAVAIDVDLGYAGPGRPVFVSGMDQLLREAIGNLLDNALRYSGCGSRVTVGVSTESTPELYVEDNGPGIPDNERTKIGQRFYRVPGVGGDGCGLGLAIVTEIARRHDARLVLETPAESKGLRARIVFETSGS